MLKRPLGKGIMTGFRLRDLPNGYIQTYGNNPRSFLKIDEELGKQMKGPVLAYGMQFANERPVMPLDLNMTDFRHLVDFFRVRYDVGKRQHDEMFSGEVIKGVRVNCKGDQVVFGLPEYEAKSEPASLCTFAKGENVIHRAPKKIGLELMIAKMNHALSWRGRRFDGQLASANMASPCNIFSIPELMGTLV